MKLLSLSLTLLVAAHGQAEESPPPPPASGLAVSLQPFDSNRDGLLTGDEVRLARQAHNRGGREAQPNARSWRRDLSFLEREFRSRRQMDFDLNADGELDKSERSAFKKVWSRISNGYKDLHAELLPKYDLNDDGELSEKEEETARPETQRRREELESRLIAEWRASRAAGLNSP